MRFSSPLRPTGEIVLAGGERLGVRALVPGDRDALAAAFAALSEESRRRRFLGPKPRLSARELTFLTELDHVAHEALVATDADGRIVGIARYGAWVDERATADVAVTVADEWQRRGIGTALTRRIVQAARANGIARLTATTMWENAPALMLLKRLGFRPCGSANGLLDLALAL
jgi:RimJ/RimL family protein N-acetyltransferase